MTERGAGTGRLRAAARRVLPHRARRLLLRVAGRAPGGRSGAGRPTAPRAGRRGPSDPAGIRRVQVGCGPENLLDAWWNVDIRPFPGVDAVMDATAPWPWHDLDAVYGEHFLEHLGPDAGLRFATEAARALKPGGVLRLSTPGLEHVWVTHFDPGAGAPDAIVAATYRANRAFHGWGHRFLYSRPMLERLLSAAGFEDLSWHAWGESEREDLRGLERHPGWDIVAGWPSVWIVEAVAPDRQVAPDPEALRALATEIEQEFARYVRSGH